MAELISTSNLPSVTFVVTALTLAVFYTLQRRRSMVPLINPKRWFEFSDYRIKQEFVHNAIPLVKQGFAATGNKPFRILADSGEVTVLPPDAANEIKSNDHMSLELNVSKHFFGHLPGFEVFNATGLDMKVSKSIVQRQLTTHLNKVTKPLSDEASLSLQEILTDNKEWHEITLKNELLQIIARISSKVFTGDELCHDKRWLDITVNYTIMAFAAAESLRMWPPYLRSIVHWFLPKCRASRAEVVRARTVIEPILKRRAEQKAAFAAQGKKAPEINDAIEWFTSATTIEGFTLDPVIAQLGLSLAAIHTTGDLSTQVILDIASHPEIIEPLRKEMIESLSEGGWKKNSLYKLKLLDSVIKESQRMKPIASINMNRITTANVTLSDGTFIPRNTSTAVSSHRMWDPSVHTNPDQWDGYRFYNKRQEPGQENLSQLVSTSPDHPAFGHGQHACPGRFFAANEIKVLLCHLLLKYDLKIVEGSMIKPFSYSFSMNANPFAPLMIRRREDVIDLDALDANFEEELLEVEIEIHGTA
ncbi:cytochrome P450, possible trichothecene C-8 hydroxylase [Histoplasma capsulatum]|uniref:Cytochrome P450, possible trichothecene C-8 hydroxylase n=1 Tax=Ajellomyces capsulatus TaxID=5037 RepID=A0A8A1MC79_AJECA|nr:cytochrome P450, possible trichothecene C-8 hydroxylase [Histoplasma capsulatum]